MGYIPLYARSKYFYYTRQGRGTAFRESEGLVSASNFDFLRRFMVAEKLTNVHPSTWKDTEIYHHFSIGPPPHIAHSHFQRRFACAFRKNMRVCQAPLSTVERMFEVNENYRTIISQRGVVPHFTAARQCVWWIMLL